MRTRMTQNGWRTEARRRSRNRNWKYADDDDAVGEATADHGWDHHVQLISKVVLVLISFS